jgi:thiamine biosynthesis lipoprotein
VPVLGTRVSFAVRHSDEREARDAIRAAVGAIFEVHQTMTLHEPSPLTYLNKRGIESPVEVPASLWSILQASRNLHQQTGGLFDATLGRLVRRLHHVGARGDARPSDKEIASLLAGVGFEHVVMDEGRRTVGFSHPDTALDFNGIAKGYAVDQAVGVLRRAGIEHFLVNAGGDLYAAGRASPESEGWPIRLDSTEPGQPPLATFQISDRAVATSGNTFQRTGPLGHTIEHLVHPGLGVPTGDFVTASAIAQTAMEADVWATAAFVGQPSVLTGILPYRGGPELHLVDASRRVLSIGV